MENDFLVEFGIGVTVKFAPFSQFLFPGFGTGREFTVFQIVESDLVGSDHTTAGTHFDRQVADGQTFFHCRVANRFAGIFNEITGSTACRHLTYNV